MMSKANPNLILAAGVVVLGIAIAAYIYAERVGIDSAPILAIVGPVIAAVFLQNGLARVEAKTEQAVKNTNGALTGGIEVAMRRVTAERDAVILERLSALEAAAGGSTPPATAGEASSSYAGRVNLSASSSGNG